MRALLIEQSNCASCFLIHRIVTAITVTKLENYKLNSTAKIRKRQETRSDWRQDGCHLRRWPQYRPVPATVAATPIAIASVVATSPSVFAETIVTVRGQVAGVYGDSFTLKDASGQTLMKTGQRGGLFNQANFVAAGQSVTV